MTSSTSSTNHVLENHSGLWYKIVYILVDHRPGHWHSHSVMTWHHMISGNNIERVPPQVGTPENRNFTSVTVKSFHRCTSEGYRTLLHSAAAPPLRRWLASLPAHCRDSCYIVVTNATALPCILVNLWCQVKIDVSEHETFITHALLVGHLVRVNSKLPNFWFFWPQVKELRLPTLSHCNIYKKSTKFCGEYCKSITGMHPLHYSWSPSPPVLHLRLSRSQSQFCQLI